MSTVVLITDEPCTRVREELRDRLVEHGFALRAISSVDEALAIPAADDSVVMLLDSAFINGHAPGTELAELERASGRPIIVIQGHAPVADRVRALEAGADDYILDPVDPEELAARIRAVMRRRAALRSPEPLRIGELELDLERRFCRVRGEVVPLARSEWQVLTYLAQHPGRVVLATELLRHCWGETYQHDLQILRICISRLRKKLGGGGRRGVIRTYHNVGYSLQL